MIEAAPHQRAPRLGLALGLALAGGVLGSALAAGQPAAAAAAAAPGPCQEIVYRLWHEKGEQTFPYGQEIGVPSGAHLHLYIQVRGEDEKPLGSSATIGYPGEFGFGGNALEVLKQVRMEAQNQADRQYGRIRFTAAAEGGASLGYRIEAVDGGRLGRLPEACRTGQVNLRVLPPPAPASLEPQAISPREAAEQLVVLLYYGLLHRRIVDQFDAGYVEIVEKRSRPGLEEIAQTILESNEFRQSAYRRAEERHGTPHRNGKPLTELLLGDMYDALYGRRRQPSQAEARQDLEDLDICLKGKAYTIATCGRLGRTLVNRQLFYDQNKDLIDSLAGGGQPGVLRPTTGERVEHPEPTAVPPPGGG